MTIDIRPAGIDDAVVLALFAELDAELAMRYPGSPINTVDSVAFAAARGYLVVASSADGAVGCGAFRPLDARTVEIKRMFVRPAFRGRGTGRMILAALEEEARRRQYGEAILETGTLQPEAITLYRACGYQEIEPFGPYIGQARSVCFGKAL